MSGSFAWEAFKHEAGGHRIQRIPPNEKRGRVHSSSVTVAVLEEPTHNQLTINLSDLEWSFSRGSGPGGQNRNVTNSAVDLKHLPSGIVVHVETERSQKQNKAVALASLRTRLWAAMQTKESEERDAVRKGQVGTGMRGDKVVTVRYQDGVVTYHNIGVKMSLRDYEAGKCP